MKTVAIVQARMNSTRLPGKALIDIHGKPVLQHVVERVRQCQLVDQIVVATSNAKTDDPIQEWCESFGVDCFRGALDDVLQRFNRCAEQYEADIIVRVTADCPLLSPSLLDRTIEMMSTGCDYAALVGYPEGIAQEAFTRAALVRAHNEATMPEDREHVVTYMLDPANGFAVFTVPISYSLDTREDLERITEYLA